MPPSALWTTMTSCGLGYKTGLLAASRASPALLPEVFPASLPLKAVQLVQQLGLGRDRIAGHHLALPDVLELPPDFQPAALALLRRHPLFNSRAGRTLHHFCVFQARSENPVHGQTA